MLSDEERFQKRLDRQRKRINKLIFREMKSNKISIEDNIKNGVKILEESFKRTNSEYFKEINKNNERFVIEDGLIFYKITDNNTSNKDKNLDFHSFFNGPKWITLDLIEKKIKEKLGLPFEYSIRYDRVKCSRYCKHKHEPHYYFYAYWWDQSIKKMKKKYIGKHLPGHFELIILENEN